MQLRKMVPVSHRTEFADRLQRTGPAGRKRKTPEEKAARHAEELLRQEAHRKRREELAKRPPRRKKKKHKKQKRGRVPGESAFVKTLRSVGFVTYESYLQSGLWSIIRTRVFDQKGRCCVKCGKTATQVHHSRYDVETMRGDSVQFLHPVCPGCHSDAEIDNGKRRGLKKANEFLGVST